MIRIEFTCVLCKTHTLTYLLCCCSAFPPVIIFWLISPSDFQLEVGAVETRFRRKCMAVLLALCPLVVEAADDLDARPADTDGARSWVWGHLEKSGRGGVAEAVRVFESSGGAARSQAASSPPGGRGGGGFGGSDTFGGDHLSGAGGGGREQHGCDKTEWDRIATSADCYNFARETKIITAGELFLGSASGKGGGASGSSSSSSDSSQGSGRASGEKRKASESSAAGGAAAGGGEGSGEETKTSSTQPRVLRSLARAVERFGKFLENFPVQSLVGDEEKAGGSDAGVTQGSRNRYIGR